MPAGNFAFDGRTLAVVGATGLVGNHLLRAASALRAREGAENEIYAIARDMPADSDRIAGVTYLAASALDDTAFAKLPTADLAIYVAGATSNYMNDPMGTIRLGTDGLAQFIHHFASAQRRLLVGSARIYGPRATPEPLDEDSPSIVRSPDSRNVYDATKLLGEALALGASSPEHPFVMTRLGNVYGPYSSPSTRTAFIDLVEQARTTRRIVLRGPGGTVRNHVYAADAAVGILRALLLGRAGTSYNIGSRDHLSNLDLAQLIATAMPFEVEVESTSVDPSDYMVLSIAKAFDELGYVPHHRASEQISATVRWLLENHL